MALIFADDFQQWPLAGILNLNGAATSFQGVSIPTYASAIEALGYYFPTTCGSGNTAATYWAPTFRYDLLKGAAAVSSATSVGSFSPFYLGASGLRRSFKYEGDTLFVGLVFEFTDGDQTPAGEFVYFGSQAVGPGEFTTGDGLQLGYFQHAFGVDPNGFFKFNGESTTVPAYYSPVTVKHFVDFVFAPTYYEVWIGNVRVIRKDATVPKKITEIAVSATNIGNTSFAIWIHSLGLADNVTPGYAQRFGRKIPKTYPITGITTELTKSANPAVSTDLAVITRTADTPYSLTGGNMLGYFGSPDGYLNTDLTVVGFNRSGPVYGACLQVQMKRLEPSADGMGVRPYVTNLAGTKLYGKAVAASSAYKLYMLEVPMDSVPKDTKTFGFMYDYADPNKLYISDTSKVEVYGPKSDATLPGFLSSQPTVTKQDTQTASYNYWAFDYAGTDLTTTKTDVINVTYQQDQ